MYRRVFNFDNNSEYTDTLKHVEYKNPVTACGCLFYRHNNGIELLLISYSDPKWPRLDDFGGKIDITDSSIDNAITRETIEESNDVISTEIMNNILFSEIFYNPSSKYVVKLVERGLDFYPDTSVFGAREIHDNIDRTIRWYKYRDIREQLAYRLYNNKELMDFLDKNDTS